MAARRSLDFARRRFRHDWRTLAVCAVLVAGMLVVFSYRQQLFGADLPVRIAVGLAVLPVGWAAAGAAGRLAAPSLARRGVGIVGPLGFLVRLVTIGITAIVALRVAGLRPETLAAGSAVTAIVAGLAAQQTLGNLFAGIVLLTARPFRLAERVRLQAGALAGQVEGVVIDSGLLYTTLARGDDKIMVPNSVVLASAVVPLREPGSVDVRARLQPEIEPTELQSRLEEAISIPVRTAPHIHLEEVDTKEVVLRVTATPASASDGAKLADEVLAALRKAAVVSGDGRAPAGRAPA